MAGVEKGIKDPKISQSPVVTRSSVFCTLTRQQGQCFPNVCVLSFSIEDWGNPSNTEHVVLTRNPISRSEHSDGMSCWAERSLTSILDSRMKRRVKWGRRWNWAWLFEAEQNGISMDNISQSNVANMSHVKCIMLKVQNKGDTCFTKSPSNYWTFFLTGEHKQKTQIPLE